jgi:hypothetical protein
LELELTGSELARDRARLGKASMTEAIANARGELKRERDKRPLAQRLEELTEKLKAVAGPQPSRGRQGENRRVVGH